MRPATRTILPVAVTGADNIPTEGPAIIAANHLSFFDTVALIGAMPRPISFLGKAEYLDGWKTRYLFPAMGMIPIERRSGKAAFEALDAAMDVLAEGGLLGIYPEGTRSRDGLLHKGRTGVARLAMASGAPVIPIGLVGTDRVQAPGQRVPRPFRPCVVNVGTPIATTGLNVPYRSGPGGYRRLTDDVMAAITALSGQTYVGRYADLPPRTRNDQPNPDRTPVPAA